MGVLTLIQLRAFAPCFRVIGDAVWSASKVGRRASAVGLGSSPSCAVTSEGFCVGLRGRHDSRIRAPSHSDKRGSTG